MKLIKTLLIQVLIVGIFIQPSEAQSANTDYRIIDVAVKIFRKLNAVQNANSRGNWDGKTLSYWNRVKGIDKNDALWEFTFNGNDKGGINELDYRERIDLTKIDIVTMGKTPNGREGFTFYAEDGENAIQQYVKNHDWTVGDYKYRSDKWEHSATVYMPKDEELLELFKEYIKLIKEDKKLHPNNYGTLNEPEVHDTSPSVAQPQMRQATAQEMANLHAVEGVLDVLGAANWEFQGAMYPATYEVGSLTSYTPVKAYEVNDARFTLAFRAKNVRINLSPAGWSWMTLPSYHKYDKAGTMISYTDFGTVQYYSPSLGFTWALSSKENRNDPYRGVEFPIAVNFAPLFAPKTDKVTIKNEAYDTEFEKYFEGLQYNVHATIGVNGYFGNDFGIGFSAGGTYVNIKTVTTKLTETMENSRQRDFTITMDDLKRIIPRLELRLICRF